MKKIFYSILIFLSIQSPLVAAKNNPNLTTAFVHLAKKVNPAVVNIRTTQLPSRPYYQDPFMDLFEQFYGFDPRGRQTQPSTALGTGFIIASEGLIITNNHVIDKADQIEVQLSDEDKKTYTAKVIGKDEKTDIALIKIDAGKALPIIRLGSSHKTEVGEWVAAFGNPLGLGHTITKGIVSAKGREVEEVGIYPFLQTDASINPGNSGGPLVNLSGEVIGVNTWIIKGAQGLGFAIPIDVVKDLIPQLKKFGKVNRGYIGISISPIDQRIQKALGLENDQGVLVVHVAPGSAGEKAGFQAYDVIKSINSTPINSIRKLNNEVAKYTAGAEIEIGILRNQKNRSIKVALDGEHEKPKAPRPTQASLKAPYKLGFDVVDLTQEMAKKLGVPFTPKAVVYAVEGGSPAARAGLSVGDIIIDINRKTVVDAKEAVRALREKSNLIRVQRGPYIALISIEN